MVKKVWDDPRYVERQAQRKARRQAGRPQRANAAADPHQRQMPVQAGHAGSAGRFGQPGIPMHYAPGHGLTPQMGHDGCTVPQLGQVPQAGGLVPVGTQLQPHGSSPLVKPQPETVGGWIGLGARRASDAVSKWSWRHRWELAPLLATGSVAITAAIDPAAAVMVTGAAGGAAGLAHWKGPNKLFGRAWLSRLERGIVAKYAAGASFWSAGVLVGGWEPGSWFGLGTLAAATTVQSISWVRSRQIRKGEIVTAEDVTMLSEKALAIMNTWPLAVAAFGPRGLLGSHLIDVQEPLTEVPEGQTPEKTGAIVLSVELRRMVHAQDVVNDENRRWLERELDQGIGTVRLETDRDHASRMRVVLTPTRHLETTSKVWPGPVVTQDGRIPIAVTPEGNTIYIRLWNQTGVNHLLLVGSSGSGKSNTYNVMLLPAVLARKAVLIYLDGKQGASNPKLAQAMDMVARTSEQRKATIRMVYAVLQDREKRYGAMGLDEFDVNGPDPIILFVIDEATGVKRELDAQEEAMVAEISEKGRSLGIAEWMSVQSANMVNLPGGGDTRKNLTGTVGNVIGMRPGDHSAKSVTLSSTSEDIDLLGLPEGPGWCAVLSGGGVQAKEARILHIPPGDEGAALFAKHIPADFTPRGLTGADARAAGAIYANRTTGRAWLADMAAQRVKAGRAREGDHQLAALAAAAAPHELEQPLPFEGTPSTPAATGGEASFPSYAPAAAGVSNGGTCEFCGQPATVHDGDTGLMMCKMCDAIAAAVERALPEGSQGLQRSDPEGWKDFLGGVIGRPDRSASPAASNQIGLAPADTPNGAAEFPHLAKALTPSQAAASAAFDLRCEHVRSVLAANRAGLTHAGIAAETNIPKAPLSRVLKRLEEIGHIRKTEAGLWEAASAETAA